jgi:succinate dehydrogenase/fumarate reductase cytochrome b subunit
MPLKRLHYFSGLTLALFVGLHLMNHLWSLAGPAAHIDMMATLRLIYRNPVVETLLLIAVGVQVVSGLRLRRKLRGQTAGFYPRLQLWSGLYLAFFLMAHVFAVMMGRFVFQLDTNYYFGAAGINFFPTMLFYIPYYSLACMAFFGHVAAIHSMKMRASLLGLTPVQQSHVLLVLGGAFTLVLLYALTQGFRGIDLPADYLILIGR